MGTIFETDVEVIVSDLDWLPLPGTITTSSCTRSINGVPTDPQPNVSNTSDSITIQFTTIANPTTSIPEEVNCVYDAVHQTGGASFLIIDEDSIDNNITFFDGDDEFDTALEFSDIDVNDQFAEIGERTPLAFFADSNNFGRTITVFVGEVGDEAWFAPQTIPPSWDAAGPTGDGIQNLLVAGPGLGTEDADGDREALLDKIPDVIPLRGNGLFDLKNKDFCAIVWDSDISINYDPIDGSLKGANYGIMAFRVDDVTSTDNYSSGTLPLVTITILDPGPTCVNPAIFQVDHIPCTSSEPYDTLDDHSANYTCED